jgi:hypothetical protein
MSNRRDFLKEAATGALLLGSQSKFVLAGILDKTAQHAAPSKSKVVIAKDPALHGTGTQPDEKRVIDLLDLAITSYTGHKNPVESWKHIVQKGNAQGKVIGLKTNGLGGKGISTHAVLAHAIAERLQQAGVKPGNILIWDRTARDLEACGFTIPAASAAMVPMWPASKISRIPLARPGSNSPKSSPVSAPWSLACPSSRTTAAPALPLP